MSENKIPCAISKLEFIGALAWLYNERGQGFDNWDLESAWDRFNAGGRVELPPGVMKLWDEWGLVYW